MEVDGLEVWEEYEEDPLHYALLQGVDQASLLHADWVHHKANRL